MEGCIRTAEDLLKNLKSVCNVEAWYADQAKGACFELKQTGRPAFARTPPLNGSVPYVGIGESRSWVHIIPRFDACGDGELLAEAGNAFLCFSGADPASYLHEVTIDWDSLARRKGDVRIQTGSVSLLLKKVKKGCYRFRSAGVFPSCPAGPAMGRLCAAFSRGPSLMSSHALGCTIVEMAENLKKAEAQSDYVKRAADELEQALTEAKRFKK